MTRWAISGRSAAVGSATPTAGKYESANDRSRAQLPAR